NPILIKKLRLNDVLCPCAMGNWKIPFFFFQCLSSCICEPFGLYFSVHFRPVFAGVADGSSCQHHHINKFFHNVDGHVDLNFFENKRARGLEF
ncbi:MAG: hypothetical protein Q8877_03465, partial [Sweet potato little leaf phytoplasma]|nr:hypothetical protein [Sweet potato little leaf phytoplasma]